MAFDDPIVWILILAVVIFLFGANKIPQFAKSIGQAKKEWDQASKAITNPSAILDTPQPATSAAVSAGAAQSALVTQLICQTHLQMILSLQQLGRKE